MKRHLETLKDKFVHAKLRLKSQAKLDEALVNALITKKDGLEIGKLLKAGANPNASNGLPLDLAVSGKNTSAMFVLIHGGAKVDIDNFKPLQIAITEDKDGIAFELMRRGAKVTALVKSLDQKDDNSRTAMKIRKWSKAHTRIVERLERQFEAKKTPAIKI